MNLQWTMVDEIAFLESKSKYECIEGQGFHYSSLTMIQISRFVPHRFDRAIMLSIVYCLLTNSNEDAQSTP
jgi:hypothetical protein